MGVKQIYRELQPNNTFVSCRGEEKGIGNNPNPSDARPKICKNVCINVLITLYLAYEMKLASFEQNQDIKMHDPSTR